MMPRPQPDPEAIGSDAAWAALLAARRGDPAGLAIGDDGSWRLDRPASPEAALLLDIHAPLCAAARAADGRPAMLGVLGSSLDGRIATENGRSHFINAPAAIDHLHRLRALADAVVVGAETVARDDPQLTVRRCTGPHPTRVILDPRGRVGRDARVVQPGVPTLLVRAAGSAAPCGAAEIATLPHGEGGFGAAALVGLFAARGWRLVLIEGGGVTVSRFVAARTLDRLHLLLAPMIIGSGRPAFALPAIGDLGEALRPAVRYVPLGPDLLLDCVFAREGA